MKVVQHTAALSLARERRQCKSGAKENTVEVRGPGVASACAGQRTGEDLKCNVQ